MGTLRSLLVTNIFILSCLAKPSAKPTVSEPLVQDVSIPKASSVQSSSGKIYLIKVEIPRSTTAIISQIIDSGKK